MANLDLKSDGNNSMPEKQRPLKASKVGCCGARVISVKAGLLEVQSSDGEYPHPPERRLTPVPHPALTWDVGRSNLQGAGDAQRGHLKKMSGLPTSRSIRTTKTYHGIA
jgi:hypothetical protein